jgi:mannan endo-1,4-beta-mannosidase
MRQGTRFHLPQAIALAAIAALLLALSIGAAPAAAKGKPLYWGAQIGKQLTGESPPWDMQALEIFERNAKKQVSILSFSAPFADCFAKPCKSFYFPTQAMETLRQRGTIPFFNWASQSVPSKAREPRYQLADLNRGAYDEYIEDFAEQVKEWDETFFLRFDWEMNGFWFPWGGEVNGNKPKQFVKAWRHVRDIFTRVGATKVTWVWCPNVDFTGKLTPIERLYPGDAYVDWTCLDGFNWGETRNSAGWQTFDEIYHSTYRRVLKIAGGKPMLIGEMASEERGGSKAQWIRKTLRTIPSRYPKVRGVIWFDENDRGMHWPIESSAKARKAFAKAIGSPLYLPNIFRDIEASPIPVPDGTASAQALFQSPQLGP